MSEARYFSRSFNDQAFPINSELDLCALGDLHLFSDRGGDSEGQAIAPLQDGLRHDLKVRLLMYSHSIYIRSPSRQASFRSPAKLDQSVLNWVKAQVEAGRYTN